LSSNDRNPGQEDVASIIGELTRDNENHLLEDSKRTAILNKLKELSRDAKNSTKLQSKDGLQILVKQAFWEKAKPLDSIEALSCVANTLFLVEGTRRMLAETTFTDQALSKLGGHSSLSWKYLFVICRNLFLLTYVDKGILNWNAIVVEKGLDTIIFGILQDILTEAQRERKEEWHTPKHPEWNTALKEVCTLLFNIAHLNPSLAPRFSPSIRPLFEIIMLLTRERQPLQQPVSAVLNTLLPLDATSKEWGACAYPDQESRPDSQEPTDKGEPNKEAIDGQVFSPVALVDNNKRDKHVPNYDDTPSSRILVILENAIKTIPESEIDTLVTPLVTLVHKLYTFAPEKVQSFLCSAVLPSDKDREHVLGKVSNTLSSHLLRLTMSPGTPTMRDAVSNLIFEMCDKDAEKMIETVGFGIASGYLMRAGIPMPNSSAGAASGSADINPITGQKIEFERPVELEDMTDEQKEMEAERLFVLFERYVKQSNAMKDIDALQSPHIAPSWRA
jgi:Guanine nucleotide exchange factor synembryn